MSTNRYVQFLNKWRWIVIAIALIVIAACGYGIRYIEFSIDYRDFFNEENPQLQAYNALEETFTKIDNLVLVIRPLEGDIFNSDSLQLVHQLTE